MKKYVAVLLMTILIAGNALAQKNDSHDYKNAVGVKFYPGALTIKHFFNEHIAGEGITYFYGNAARITGLLEFHFDIKDVPGLKWYIGPGAHISFVRYKNQANTFAGIDGVLGLDYKFRGIPVNLSVDWQPSFEFGENPQYTANPGYVLKDGPGFTGSWAGIGVRYTF